MDELVSVIVPVYNVEKYLERCVRSIMAQTYKNIEILVVNDGSTDSSPQILEKLAGEDNRVSILTRKNGGLSAARNTGIDNAKGAYIAFVDSDDYVHPRMIELLYKNLVDYNADLSVCDLYWIYDEEKKADSLSNNVQVYDGIAVMHRLIGDDLISVVAWNKLYRASIFTTVRYPEGKFHEDEHILHLVFAQCKRTVYTDAKLYYYIKRLGSISNKITKKNIIDTTEAFSKRLVWASNNVDKKFTNWCFNVLLNECNYALRQDDMGDYNSLVTDVSDILHRTLLEVGFSHNITWRKMIVGYLWLCNPKVGNKARFFLHC